jgi:NTE family protein
MKGVALVLGGGGVAGIAWMTGVAAGLADEGVDLRAAEQILGTSAGATVGAQLSSGASLEELFARQADPERQTTEISPPFAMLRALLTASQDAIRIADVDERIRRLGRMALDCATVSESERRAVIAGRLPSHRWPANRLSVTAFDAETGELRLFDAASGVDLIDAVAASCAVPLIWPAVAIHGRRYLDGGLRSAEHADRVVGAGSVVILSPLGIDAQSFCGIGLRGEIGVLEANGSRVAVIEPDAAAKRAIGINLLDPGTRKPAAEAGRLQGRREARRIMDFAQASSASGAKVAANEAAEGSGS